MDFSGKHTATVFTIRKMGGVLGAVVCPVVVGFLSSYIELSKAGWSLVLLLFMGVYLARSVFTAVLNPN